MKLVKVNLVCLVFLSFLIFISNGFSQSFYDDFNDGDLNGWTVIDGSWNVTNPGYNSDSCRIESGNVTSNNIRANISVGFGIYEYYTKIDGPSQSDSDILINYQDSQNYIRIGLHTPGDSDDHIVQYLNGVHNELTSTSEGLVTGVWSHVKVERLTNGLINVYLDGNLHMSAMDTMLTNPGNIVLRSWWYPVSFDNVSFNSSLTSAINIKKTNPVENFELFQNLPNPFNPTTTILYSLKKTNKVTLKIFDTLGQEIETLVNTNQNSGEYEVKWNANNYSSGIYFYQLETGGFSQTKKLILLR